MEDLTLSLEKDFWTVGDLLIEKLDKLANPPTGDSPPEAHRFPDENVLYDQIKFAREQATNLTAVVANYKDGEAAIQELNILYVQQGTKTALEIKEPLQAAEKLDAEEKLEEIIKQLATYDSAETAENEEYKKLLARQISVGAEVEGKRVLLNDTKEKLVALAEVDQQIERVKQRLQTSLSAEEITEITSLDSVITKEELVQEKRNSAEADLVAYKTDVATLEAITKTLAEQYDKIKANMRTELAELKKFQASSDRKNVDFDLLQKSLTKLAGVTPGIYKEVVQEFTQNASAAEYDVKREQLKKTLTGKFKDKFNQPGSSHEAEVEVEIGAGISAGALSARGTFIGSFKYKVGLDASGKYSITKEFGGKIKIRGRAGVELSEDDALKIRVGIAGALKKEGTNTYNSMDDFIDSESTGFSAAFLDYSLGSKILPTNIYKDQKAKNKVIKFQEEAIAGKASLEHKLRLTGMLRADQQLTAPVRKNISYVKSSATTASAEAQASLAFKFNNYYGVGGGIKLEGSVSQNHKQKVINLIDDLAQHPTLEKLYAIKNPQGYLFVTREGTERMVYSGSQALEKLNAIETQIDEYRKNPDPASVKLSVEELRRKVKHSLERLSLEYQSFVSAENNAESGGSTEHKDARDKMRASRGTNDSANYLKAVSLQYANLRRMYDKSFGDNEPLDLETKDFMDGFEQDLKCPQFKISEKKYKSVFNIDQKTEASTVLSNGVFITLESKAFFEGADNLRAAVPGVRLGMKYANTTTPSGDVSEEMSLSFNVLTGVKGDHFVAKLLQLSDIKKYFESSDNEQEVKAGITAALQSAVAGNLEVKLYRKKNGWNIKYVRGYEASEKKIGGKAVVNMGTVDAIVGGSVRTAHVTTVFERPGVNSLSYITDIYRARKIRSKRAGDWEAYDKETGLLDKMVAKLKDKKSNIAKEMNEWLKEMAETNTPESVEMATQMKDKLKIYQGSNSAEAISEFKEDFVKLIAQRTANEDTRNLAQFHTRRTAQRQSMRAYAADVIAKRMDVIVQENNLTEADGGSVDKMVKWAKKRYKKALADVATKNPSEAEAKQALKASGEVLKSVFSIEYTSTTLEDLISSDKKERHNIALNMLDTEMNALLEEQAKVYLDKNLTGELATDVDGKLKIKPKVGKGKENIFTGSKITSQVNAQMKDLECEVLPTAQIDSLGQEAAWKEPAPRRLTSHKSARLLSKKMRSFKSYLPGGNQKISQYIATVMEKAFEKRRKQEQQRKAKAAAAQGK